MQKQIVSLKSAERGLRGGRSERGSGSQGCVSASDETQAGQPGAQMAQGKWSSWSLLQGARPRESITGEPAPRPAFTGEGEARREAARAPPGRPGQPIVNTWPRDPRTTPRCAPPPPARRPRPPRRRGGPSSPAPGARGTGAGARSRRPERSAPARPGGRPAAPRASPPSKVSEGAQTDADAAPGQGRFPAPHPIRLPPRRAAERGGRREGGAARRASGAAPRGGGVWPARPRPPGSLARGSRWPALGGLAAASVARGPAVLDAPALRGPRAAPRPPAPRPAGPAEEDGLSFLAPRSGGGWWDSALCRCKCPAGGRGTGALGWEGAPVVAVNSRLLVTVPFVWVVPPGELRAVPSLN